MKYSSIANRIDKLEKQEHESKRVIKIANLPHDKWAVLKDHAEFDFLKEAVAYVREKYNTHSIKVCQLSHVLASIRANDLKAFISVLEMTQKPDQQATPKQQQIYDEIMRQVQEPCDQLVQVQQDNPKINFELFYITDDELDDYFRTQH